MLYSEDFKFLDTAILGSLLVATPHTDGSDLKLSTGGNGENEGQSQGKRFSLRYVCYLLFKSAPLVRMGNLWSKKDGRTFLLWFSRSKGDAPERVLIPLFTRPVYIPVDF